MLKKADFETLLRDARKGDIIYCDPTYQGSKRLTFDRYGKTVFDWADQKRLAASARSAMRNGATVIVSNVAIAEISELYTDAIQIELMRRKAIGNRALNESSPRELLAVFDPIQRQYWLTDVFPSLIRSSVAAAAKEHDGWRQAAE